MLDIGGKNICNKKLSIKSFFEGFQFVLKCLSIKFDASSWYGNDLIFIDASSVSFHGVHWLWKGVGSEMEELGVSSTKFLTVSMFS